MRMQAALTTEYQSAYAVCFARIDNALYRAENAYRKVTVSILKTLHYQRIAQLLSP